MVSFDPAALFRPLPSVLHAQKAAGGEKRTLRIVVAASAEGYAFPTNLDHDQPIGGLAPETQAELVWRGPPPPGAGAGGGGGGSPQGPPRGRGPRPPPPTPPPPPPGQAGRRGRGRA